MSFFHTLRPLALGLMVLPAFLSAGAQEKLTGTPIGTNRGYDYSQGKEVENIQGRAFDGDLNTYFATYDRSFTWVGLDLGKQFVITKVGWCPRNDQLGPDRVDLGIFEGANSPDFMDAVPIYMVKEKSEVKKMSYGTVDCSKGFRYVRWVSTSDARCNIAELEFYGVEGAGDDSHLYQITNLPTVCINTVNAEIPYDKENDITSNVIIINDGKVNVEASGGVRERGNGSRQFPKKPWRIKFDKKQKVLDAPSKAKKWTLINNYGDKTLMRNIVAFEIARRAGMTYVPFCQPVDVIMNGEYKGCYQLCDQVEVNPGRVDITEMTPEDTEGDALKGGYLIEVDAYANQEPEQSWFTSEHGTPVTIKSPKDDEIQPVQKKFITDFFNKFENGLYADDYKTKNPLYFDIFDLDSFLQYFIVSELVGNTDSFWSTYMYKDRNSEKFFTGPLWDIDLGFDNDSRTYPISTTAAYNFLSLTSVSSIAGNMRNNVRRIVVDNEYNRERMSELWSIARDKQGLDAKSLEEYIDKTSKLLRLSQELNFRRWPILNEKVHMNPVALGSFTAEVSRLKSYLSARLEQLDDRKLMRYNAQYSAVKTISSEETGNQLTIQLIGSAVNVSEDVTYTIHTVAGANIFNGKGTSQDLPAGMYIVTAKGYKPYKLVIR